MRPPSPPEARTAGAIVLDTNVVLDWLLFRGDRSLPVGAAVQAGRLRWIASPIMRLEFSRVVARPMAVQRGAQPHDLMAAWDRWATLHDDPPPGPASLRCRDASDQPFLDLALAQRANWLLTRDRALLVLAGRAARLGLRIAVPERWTDLL